MTEAQRCPDCGALVSEDAEWCGQCFRSLKALTPEALPDPAPVAVTRLPTVPPAPVTAVSDSGVARDGPAPMPDAPDGAPTWPCPACENANPIELDACAVCGTSFASLMRQDEPAPQVSRSL